MRAAIVSIGDELLIGQVIDTNSTFIGKTLESIGCVVEEKTTIADTVEAITGTMRRYQNKVDLVVFTGGLGPTKDDVTKKTFAYYFDDELVMNDEVYAHVKNLIEAYYKRPISEMNRQQALVPSKATILFNDLGTAPGMLMQKERTTFVSFPGVPYEMKPLVTDKLVPYIKTHFDLEAIVHTTVLTYGVGESLLAEKIEAWEDSLALMNIKLAYLPQLGMVRLRLSKKGRDLSIIQSEINQKIDELAQLIPKYFIGVSEASSLLEEVIGLLKSKKITIATAESCTGGNIAQQLSSFAGASAYFKGSAITYATQSKVDVLGVQASTIAIHSVVSEQVAQEMAEGVRKLYNADIGLSTTGNAGPDKGDSDQEVGTVCLAIATAKGTQSYTFVFPQPRHRVIESTVKKAWMLLYQQINEVQES